MIVWWLAAPALAGGWSADIELVRPTLGASSVAGVDTAAAPPQRAVRVGLFGQYEKNPLVLIADGGEAGAIVGNRLGFGLGVSTDATDDLTLRMIVPGAAQWGSTIDKFSADGGGLGDASLGATYRFAPGFAGHADLALPTSTRDAWLGESQPRLAVGAAGTARAGDLLATLDVGVVARQRVTTENDFILGSELVGGASARYPVVHGIVDVVAALHARGGFAHLLGGGAENTAEGLAGVSVVAGRGVLLDAMIGRGLGSGYGTTDARGFLGVTFVRALAEREIELADDEPPAEVVLEDAPDVAAAAPVEDPEFQFEPEPPPPPAAPAITWNQDELARLIGQRIVVRDPIRFAVGTEKVLPESIPTLDHVASLLQPGDLLVVEGHASEEGSHASNYTLSVRRAQSIAEELVKLGLPASRISWRGMGEVDPVSAGSSEAERAQNRRATFYVVRLEGEAPAAAPEVVLPWSGKSVPARTPAAKETP